ncbi:glycoside hydrolase family 16 protein [Scleroderma citrinum]
MVGPFATSVVVAIFANIVSAGTYQSTSNLVGQGLLDAFYWQTISDPSNGRVNYVSESTAQSSGLVSVSGNQVTLRADSTSYLDPSGPGRNSFRLESNNQYTTHVAVFDIAHMPEGCGTWPAEVGANWPSQGEVDIVEGVDNQSPNLSSLHTSSGCSMPQSRSMTGTPKGSLNCDVYATSNTGCGVYTNDQKSFGPSFNGNGGGWYAIERSSSFIKIWFWERGSSVPGDVRNPGPSVNTNNWGTPAAYYPNTDCDLSSHLGPHNIIINLTFCGDWAGDSGVYSSSGCPSTCVDYVNDNPSAFDNAYFTFNSINIYQ